MAGIYEEVEIEDMKWDLSNLVYTYPCPCGDKFTISLEELHDGEDVATCPSCTLRIRVIFDADALLSLEDAQRQQRERETEAVEGKEGEGKEGEGKEGEGKEGVGKEGEGKESEGETAESKAAPERQAAESKSPQLDDAGESKISESPGEQSAKGGEEK